MMDKIGELILKDEQNNIMNFCFFVAFLAVFSAIGIALYNDFIK
jgi:hypothetical protein